jgi:hypothetical protein
MRDIKRGAYTLVELLVFLAIFVLVIVGFTTVLITVTRVQTRQSSSIEVDQQSQFLLQQFQYYITQSSLIDIPQDTPTSTLILRMGNSAIDPTTITINSGAVYLQQGANPAAPLTSNRVSVSGLLFAKHSNPPAHDAVSVSFTVSSNTNPTQPFSQSFQTSIARVSAATFDSNLVPSSTNQYSVGLTGKTWTSINGILNFTAAGNIGIGVGNTNPDQQLTLTNNLSLPVSASNTNGNLFFGGDTSVGVNGMRLFSLDSVQGDYIDAKVSTSTKGLLFRVDTTVGGTPRMMINAAGNVGIGTTAPNDHLVVSGTSDQVTTIQSTSGSGSNAAVQLIGGASNADWYIGTNRADIAGSGDNLFFYKSLGTGSTKMVIQDNGKVGIGTVTPLETLQVVGDVLVPTTIAFQDDTRFTVTNSTVPNLTGSFSMPQYGIGAPAVAGSADLWLAGNHDVRFFTAGNPTPRMSIDVNGNVGIGTTNPSAKLEIGTVSPATVSQALRFTNQGAGSGTGDRVNFNNAGVDTAYIESALYTGTPLGQLGYLAFGTGLNGTLSEKVRIDTSGNVGIGTTNPDNLLSVNGSADKTGGGSWGTFSDARLKDIGTDFTLGLSEVMQLQPIYYNYKLNNALGLRDTSEHVGLIAQNVQKVIPDAVTTNSRGYLILNNDPIIFAMLNAIKELNAVVVKIENGIVHIKDLIVDTITARKVVTNSFEMKDTVTGDTYCMTIANGNLMKTKGGCE